MEKMKPFDAALLGFDIVAGAGVDTILTGIVDAVIPTSYGLPGIIQKVCIKTATIGISVVAAEAMDRVIKSYVKEIAESFKEELDKEMAK